MTGCEGYGDSQHECAKALLWWFPDPAMRIFRTFPYTT